MSATCPEKVFEKYSHSCEGLPRIARQFIAGYFLTVHKLKL